MASRPHSGQTRKENSATAIGHILGATSWLRERGLSDSATQLEADAEVLRVEIEKLRVGLEQIAYGLWGDIDNAKIVAQHKTIAREALGEELWR